MRRWLLAAGLLLLAPCTATASSLPRVGSGKLPGPPLLYAKAPHAPQLENHAPFRARPLLVSGTDAYRDVTGDGRALVRLTLPCSGGAPASRQVLLTRGGATVLAPSGSHRWVILPED
jgi:hypothetical protein